MTVFSRLLVCAFCALLSVAQPALAQTKTVDARIVILDASGSMATRNEYPTRGANRWDEVTALAEEYFDQLEERSDNVPTEVMIFGATTSYSDAIERERKKPASQRRFTNSVNYPASGPLCEDIKFVTSNFAPPGSTTWKTLDDYISDLGENPPPGGMTPQGPAFNLAIKRLIAKYGPGVHAEIVTLSDFEEVNCAPPDQTICAQIAPSLQQLKQGRGSVEMRVIGVPNSRLAPDLQECLPISEDKHDPADTPQKTIEDFLGNISVVATVRSQTAGVLNPSNIDLHGMTFQVFKKGRALVAGGPAQDSVPVAPGTYLFVLSNGSEEWTVEQEVKTSQTIEFNVDAGTLELNATRDGAPLSQLDAVEIRDRTGTNIAPAVATRGVANYPLMAGQYELVVRSGGQTKTLPISVSFGKRTSASVDFNSSSNVPRSVSIILDIRTPSVDVIPFNPSVRLSGSGIAPMPLTSARNSLSLVAGSYDVAIGGARPHSLRFDVADGTTPMEVRIVVAPGWFEAKAPVPKGSFELLNASGTVIATFDDDVLRHSIADGNYTLVHIDADGNRRQSQLRITAGDFTQARF